MKLYRLAENFWVFGYVHDADMDVQSAKVPYTYAQTYGDKRGINHLDIFGHAYLELTGSAYTWIWNGDKIQWYGEPTQEMMWAVEENLMRQYGINCTQHEHEGNNWGKTYTSRQAT